MSEQEKQRQDPMEKFCGEQIRRLRVLDFFPQDGVAKGELVKALWRHAVNENHAERIIDACLKQRFGINGRSCPTPAELGEVAEQVSANADPEPPLRAPDRNCKQCGGSGWKRRTWTQTQGVFAGTVYEAHEACDCRKGAAA